MWQNMCRHWKELVQERGIYVSEWRFNIRSVSDLTMSLLRYLWQLVPRLLRTSRSPLILDAPQATIKDIPTEVLLRIFSMLQDRDLVTLTSVCVCWNELVRKQGSEIMRCRLEALGAQVSSDESVLPLYGKDEVPGLIQYPSTYSTNQDLCKLYSEILPAIECSKKRTEVARMTSLQPKMSLSLRLEYRKAFNELLDQICRKSNCKPMCIREMCPECTSLSSIRWVLFQDVEQVYTGNFLPHVRTFVTNVEDSEELFIRFDDLISHLQEQQGPLMASIVERELLARELVVH